PIDLLARLLRLRFPVTDAGDFPPHAQSLEPTQNEIEGIFQDREEVMRLDAPHHEPNFSEHGVELYPGIVLLIAKEHAISPMFIQGIAMCADDEPTHNSCRDELKAIDHLQVDLPIFWTFRPVW